MKSMNDIKEDMSALYNDLRDGKIDLKLAAELANVTGKNLKAEQLLLARDIFMSGQPIPLPPPPAAKKSEKHVAN